MAKVSVAASQKSTTGRAYRRGFPRALRAGIGALEMVAPSLVERIAERLFMTPPRHPQPGWEKAAVEGGDPFAIEAAGAVVRGLRLGAGPPVLLVHGWGGRGSQLAILAPPLVAAGCSAILLDGPAHGASEGRRTNMVKFAETLHAAAVRLGARAAIGHSFGGAALAFALHRGLALDAVVLVGSPRTPQSFFDPFCAALGLGEKTRDALRRRVERSVGFPMADLDLAPLVGALDTPALVVHDRKDAEVSFEVGATMASAWPGARLLPTEGLGHRRILRDPAVVAEIASFVVGRLSRCGCGRLAVAAAEGAPRCETCLLAIHLSHPEERAPRSGFDASVDAILGSLERGPDPAAAR